MEEIMYLWHLCFPPVNHHFQYRPEANVFIPFQSFLISLGLGGILAKLKALGSPCFRLL
jgi:hypothetical protein